MGDANKTYTYRCDEKVKLDKSTDEIVVRALPAALDDASIIATEQVSSASTRIKVSSAELALMDRSRVADHDLNQRMSTYQFSRPLDPEYTKQWHLHTAFNDPDYDTRSSALCEDAWRLLDGFGSEEVVIAVTDDGCKLDHLDFDSPDKFAGWSYFRGTRLVMAGDIHAALDEMYITGSNHGTSCNGVIGGELDAVLTVGAAAGCQLLPVQWESSGPSLFISDSKLLTALDYIADKADVMSNSWGGVPISTWSLPVINRIKILAKTGGRRGKGIVFLWAAGNENCPINLTASEEVPYDNGVTVQGGALVWVGVKKTRSFQNNLVGMPGVMHIAALASTAKRSHPYISDLLVELISPENISVLLHNRSGGSANNIIKTYTMINTSRLQNLRGASIDGNWKLKVADLAGADQGKLNRWALKIKGVPQ